MQKIPDDGGRTPGKDGQRKKAAGGLDASRLAGMIRLERPDIYYKSSAGMAEVPDGSVHLVVTSPPYNVGKQYGGGHDDSMPLDEYLAGLDDTWRECVRVLCGGGRLAVNVADAWRSPYVPLHSFITRRLLDMGLLMRGVIYWNKGAGAGASTAWGSWLSASNPVLRDVGEYILVFSKASYGLQSRNGISTITSSEFTEYTRSLWTFPPASAKREGHPAPFPEELPSRLIKLYTFLGDTVLDPFIGSGTTARAAMLLGRKCIGYEANEGYRPLIEKKTGGVSAIRIDPDSFRAKSTAGARGKPARLEDLYPPSGDTKT